MKVAVMQSNYIPWKGYFDMINSVDTFVLYDTVQYTKNDWRNRNKIVTRQGPQWLTIPVRVQSLQQTINETRVAQSNWNKKHWSTLQANYAKSPYFSEYRSLIEDEYKGLTGLSLSEINHRLITIICEILEIGTNIIRSEDLELTGDKNQRLIQICNLLGASSYLSGPAAKDYIDEALFEKNDIEVEWMRYENYREYPQLWPEFDHAVSVLDLIFNTGGEAKYFLNSNERPIK
ncbi:MAG: WbqC family protein [Acidiferrobacterales bacterium]|nr:WbqC family protein [Acidiferrobacterales bacterium]